MKVRRLWVTRGIVRGMVRAAAFVSLAGALACGQAPTDASDQGGVPGAGLERDTDALLQTDSLAYTLARGDRSYDATIGVRFTNRTGARVYLANCNGVTGVTLEKLEDGEWRMAWRPMLPLCLSVPIEVAPGGSYDLTVALTAGYPDNDLHPKFLVDELDGVYRLVWDAGYSYQGEAGVPTGSLSEAQRTSNRFRLAVGGR